MMMKEVKRNCLFFYGASNAGESLIMRSLRDCFCDFGSMTKNDVFGFEDCLDRQVNVNEEMLTDPKNVDIDLSRSLKVQQ